MTVVMRRSVQPKGHSAVIFAAGLTQERFVMPWKAVGTGIWSLDCKLSFVGHPVWSSRR